jgi:hypothetical protein
LSDCSIKGSILKTVKFVGISEGLFSMLVMVLSMIALGFSMYAKHVAWDIPFLDTVSIIGKT